SVHGLASARIEKQLVDRDRPHRDGGDQKPDHYELDDPVRMQEQLPHRKRCGGGRHGISLRVSSSSGVPVPRPRPEGWANPATRPPRQAASPTPLKTRNCEKSRPPPVKVSIPRQR